VIVFDLRCCDEGAIFEAWFRSSRDYEEQLERGLVQCPYCSSCQVEKAPMAPRLAHRDVPSHANAGRAALRELQSRLLSQSEWIGEEFPDQARAMHFGEIAPRPVHGQATAGEARSLIDDGVPILPLPLPVVPPDQVN
jgi:hypothetical protein